jgi:iron complex transport system ATP-binding protein
MASTISVENARFGYGEKDVFRDVNLSVSEGEILCLLGPNGCGKTTLLKCIAGAMRLKGGYVYLNGRDTTSLSVTEVARNVGFVFQEHTVVFPFTVLELVRMGRTPHLGLLSAPSSRDTEIAEEALETVGIWPLKDKPYTQMSGGERQLALIARALTQQPQVLLLDEPTSHLDFGNQVLILKIVRRLVKQRGLSVLMATHFPNHAMLVSSKVVLMKHGELSTIGDPDITITEANLRMLYGIEVKIVCLGDRSSGQSRVVVPMMDPTDD